MALNVTELRGGAVFKADGALWQVITYEHIKMGRGSGTVKLKVRNMKTGSVTEKGFITGARVDEANVERRKSQYLYNDGENYYFMDNESFEQFTIPLTIMAGQEKYLFDGLDVNIIIAEEEPISIEIPNSLQYEITETGPDTKGNTVSNVYKEATLNNGLVVKVPMFMKVGEKIKVDTRTGEYVERVK
jgi:elongation factor P